MSRSDRGGVAGDDQISIAIGNPPLPSASPPPGGRKGVTHRSLAGGAATFVPRSPLQGELPKAEGVPPRLTRAQNLAPHSDRRLPTLRRIRIHRAQLPLRIQNPEPIDLLPLPQRLHILNHSNNLIPTELIFERRHIAAKPNSQAAFAHHPKQQAIPVMPRVSLTIQRGRRQPTILIPLHPILRAFTRLAMAGRARRGEYLLPGPRLAA